MAGSIVPRKRQHYQNTFVKTMLLPIQTLLFTCHRIFLIINHRPFLLSFMLSQSLLD